MYVLALESSTSSAKAMLLTENQQVAASLTQSYPASFCRDGIYDTEAICRLTMELGAKIAAGKEVAAVAICGIWHSIALCDSGLHPLGRTYCWNFMAPSESCAAVRKDSTLTDMLYQRTGCMPHVTYARQALHYLRQQGEDISSYQYISQGAYLFYQLTGEYAESPCTVSGAGLLNIHNLTYDSFVLDWLGLRQSQFGQLRTYQDTAPLTKTAAEFLGIPSGIPVVPSHADGAMNQLASCAADPGRMTISVGTSGAIRMTVNHPVFSSRHQLWCYVGVTDWITGAATAGSCNCVDWFRRDFLQGKWSYEELEQGPLSKDRPPVFLPFLFGERCPGWQDNRKGCFLDLNGSHRVQDLYASLQTGILFNLYQCFLALEEAGSRPEHILVSGGILNSPRWVQMLANIFGHEMICMPIQDASITGAAALALHAAGALSDIREFGRDLTGSRVITPDASMAEYYAAQYLRFSQLYKANIE